MFIQVSLKWSQIGNNGQETVEVLGGAAAKPSCAQFQGATFQILWCHMSTIFSATSQLIVLDSPNIQSTPRVQICCRAHIKLHGLGQCNRFSVPYPTQRSTHPNPPITLSCAPIYSWKSDICNGLELSCEIQKHMVLQISLTSHFGKPHLNLQTSIWALPVWGCNRYLGNAKILVGKFKWGFPYSTTVLHPSLMCSMLHPTQRSTQPIHTLMAPQCYIRL